MRRLIVVFVLVGVIATLSLATPYTERGRIAMEYIANPANNMFTNEGLVWKNGDATNIAPPHCDNRSPSYLGAYFFSTAAVLLGMNAWGVADRFSIVPFERVFLMNRNLGTVQTAASGTEPWWNENTGMSGWLSDSFLMTDANIPWRFDPTPSLPINANEVYLERVLWATYMLSLCDNYEYSPYIAKIIRSIRRNSLYYNSLTGAIKYDGNDNLYLTALWGLVLEAYRRTFDSYPARMRADAPPPDIDRATLMALADDAWNYVNTNYATYMATTLPAFWAGYSGLALPRGLQRWENMAVMMFAASYGQLPFARSLWNAHFADVTPANWAISVRTYFRTGQIWDAGLARGYYEPLHRYPGIYAFCELACIEMYRATLDSIYINYAMGFNAYWDPRWTRTGGNYWHSSLSPGPLDNETPIYNGIHAWVLAQMPDIEIVDIWSNLPSEGPPPYDYSANIAQDHSVTVRVANHSWIPIDSLRLRFNETYTGGTRSGQILIPYIPAKGYTDIVYNIGGPGLAGDHWIRCTFMGTTYLGPSYVVNDSDLVIRVQNPARMNLVFTGGDPVTAPRAPKVTIGSDFNIELRINNIGGANIRRVKARIAQSSGVGVAFTIPTTLIDSIVNIPGGGTGSIMFPANAGMNTGIIGTDVTITATILEAEDENDRTLLAPAEITITDNIENFDVQGKARLTATGINSGTFWVNATNVLPVTVQVTNLPGDVATADSLDTYQQTLELIASVVTGINGLNAPVSTPAGGVPAGATGSITFNLSNNGASHNAIVDVKYTGHYHDGNRGDEAESPFSPMITTFPSALGIDILPPNAQPNAPVAGTPWPTDDTVRIMAVDNLSGVATVSIYLMNVAMTQYWNFGTGAWQAGFYAEGLSYSGGEWKKHLPNHPVGNFLMFINAVDTAGNAMPVRRVPLGTISYVHLADCFTNNWRMISTSPIDSTLIYGYEYECDWGWTYRCSVLVFNPNAFAVNNVKVELYSTIPSTAIIPITAFLNLAAFESKWYKFNVSAPGYTCKDSLYAHVTDGTTAGGNPIGEQITDNDTRVKVEKAVNAQIFTVYVDPADINVWKADTALVTAGQVFHVFVVLKNDGEDFIDSVRLNFTQVPGMGTVISPSSVVYTRMMGGETRTLRLTVTAGDNTGLNPEQFDQNIIANFSTNFDADNHPPLYTAGLLTIGDDRAPIGIQEPPIMNTHTFLANGDRVPLRVHWINRTNTVTAGLRLYNSWATATGTPKTDRASADRFLSSPTYSATLTLMDPTLTIYADRIRGLSAVGITDAVVEPGETTMVYWNLSWDGIAPSYEGLLTAIDVVEYGDENYQAQVYAESSPHCDTFPDYLGIDVTRPICNIVFPRGRMYADFPETVKVRASDGNSGLLADSVKAMFKDPLGNVYDGTIWRPGTWWFRTHYDITVGADTFWYDVPGPTVNGCYTYYAYAYDIAGNKSLIDQTNFIWDNIAPRARFTAPSAGFYSYSGFNIWNRLFNIYALDDTTAGYSCVAHVRNVYIAIRDTLRNKWWDPSFPGGWRTSATAYWLPCNLVSYPTQWRYSGYTDNGSAVLEVFTYARDSVGNFFTPSDTIRYIVIDNTKPKSVLTDKNAVELPNVSMYNPDTWLAVMNDMVWGYATDSIARVDSVKYSIKDSLRNRWWNGTMFVSGSEIWLTPNQYSRDFGSTWGAPTGAAGEALGFGQRLDWRANFIPTECGWYRIRSKCWDDLGNEETAFNNQNTKVIMFDNRPPVIRPRYPVAGGVYFIDEWRDTLKVFVFDSCGYPMTSIDSVHFWVRKSTGEYWGYMPFLGWNWYSYSLRVNAWKRTVTGDSIWYYFHPSMFTEAGTYTMFVRAYDSARNTGFNAWGFTLTLIGGYMTIRPVEPDPFFFVNDTFHLRITAYNHPGVIDTNFAYELVFGDNIVSPTAFQIVTPGPYYTYRGVKEIACVGTVPLLGVLVWVDAPMSGLARAVTEPIDIIAGVDYMLGGFVRDNPNDQGDWLWIHHNRSKQDPNYGGPDIDTLSIKVLEYRYYRDMNISTAPGDTNWARIVSFTPASDGDSVRILFNNFGTFQEYQYSMIVKFKIQGLGDSLFTNRIMLGYGRPYDNIAPANVANLRINMVGGNIRLDWDAVTLGWDGSPEINPAVNIVYDVYKFTNPYAPLGTPTWTGVTNVFLVDPTGAGDITTPYFYAVKARDFDNNASLDGSNRVGEVDYIIANGWSAVGYPLPVAGVNFADQYGARLGVNLDPMYSYVNPPGGWNPLILGGFPLWPIAPGRENMMAWATGLPGTVIKTWTGNVPAYGTTVYTLARTSGNGWNGIMIPVHRNDLNWASDLYYELRALGYDPITVARRIPGGGWDDIVVIGSDVYFDFPIYPGHVYLVWVNVGGVWPVYVRGERSEPTSAEIPAEVRNAIGMPVSEAIRLITPDGAELNDVVVKANYGKQSILGTFDKGLAKIEFSDFEGISAGDVVSIEISANGGAYIGNTIVTVPNTPISIGKEMLLESTRPSIPTEFALRGNIPNPFNSATTILFDIPVEVECELVIFDLNGRLVRKLVSEKLDAGYYRMIWDGTDNTGKVVSGGVYFYTLKAGSFSAKSKMMLVK